MRKATETSIEATAYAHKSGLQVVCFPHRLLARRTKMAIELIEKVGKEGHMGVLALVDTFGVLSPHAMKYFIHRPQLLAASFTSNQ